MADNASARLARIGGGVASFDAPDWDRVRDGNPFSGHTCHSFASALVGFRRRLLTRARRPLGWTTEAISVAIDRGRSVRLAA
jgi:hypothetical protein